MIHLSLTRGQARLIESALNLGISKIDYALTTRNWPDQVTDPDKRKELEDRREDARGIIAAMHQARSDDGEDK